MLWLYKYGPNVADVPHETKKIVDFITNYKKQKKRSLLIHGPPGVGKTAAVYAIARKLDLELLEINASDVRNADSINTKIGGALKQQSLFSKGKIVLVDELDGISGVKDRGGTTALASLAAKSSFPIILIANDAYSKKLKNLKKKSVLVEFEPVPVTAMTPILDSILRKEGLSAEDGVTKALARRSGGDLRGAIIDLQVLSAAGLTMASLDTLSERAQTESIKQALVRIFKSTDPLIAKRALDQVSESPDHCMLWIAHNLPKEYTEPADLARAYEHLSRADVFKGRIRRWQHWRFLVYVFTLMSSGVAVAKDKRYPAVVNYEQTKRLLKLWMAKRKYAKRDAIAQKLAKLSHCSKKKAIHQLPYLQKIAQSSPDMAKGIIDQLDLDEDEAGWLTA